ncbi:MAG: sigma 54-interacting transcriptional regulator [Lautropia sp.]|nr:sigma 54-interacting transcriptional regulator [Lautropia sp.]
MIVELTPEHAIGLQSLLPGKDVLLIHGLKKALIKLHTTETDVIVLDFGTHGGPDPSPSPVDACKQLATAAPSARIIAIGATDELLSEQLLLPNVYDILNYPSETNALAYAVDRASRLQRIRHRAHTSARPRTFVELLPGIMSGDPTMKRIAKRSQRLVGHNVRILIQGEPGSGRKALARFFAHAPAPTRGTGADKADTSATNGNAPNRPLPYLLACSRHTQGSEIEALFREAISQASSAQPPVVVLENIEQIDPTTQTELLYLLNNNESRWKDINSLPQVISIAGPSLGSRIVDGHFRRDLYDRLGQVHLCLPPLRQRGEDIRELAECFLEQHRLAMDKPQKLVLADEALQAINRHNWPGNITELENVMQRATIAAEGVYVQAQDLGLPCDDTPAPITLRQARDEAEHSAILIALKHANGSIAKAANTLAISRPTLYDLLAKHQIR